MGLYTVLDSRDIIADSFPKLEATMETIWSPRCGNGLAGEPRSRSINTA